ncbi:anion permease [Clostridia bacterium]|nr:anion permease [Clostridia bacterium]
MPDLIGFQWIWVIIAAALVGFSKMGLGGVSTIVIPLLASVFGGKESSAIMLPIALIGDLLAISYYRRNADWKAIRRLLPWALIGLIIGTIVGYLVDNSTFTFIIGITVLLCAIILIYIEVCGERFSVPQKLWFYVLMGIVGGFTTMIGNAAGPVMTVYLLAMGMKKNRFVGTYAWFFLIVNALKMPLQILLWRSIGTQQILLALSMIPAIVAGAILGTVVVKRIPEKPFRYVIIALTMVSAVRLFI